MSAKQFYQYNKRFELEAGGYFPDLTIAYHTYGKMNADKSNVVWICHALTANSDVEDWWPGMVGEGCHFDPEDYYIVCANMLGSCYGSTGPLSINSETGKPYYLSFPMVTIRDMVNAYDLLRQYLKIDKINTVIGGSCGGHQALEMALLLPDLIENLVVCVSSATESAWSKAVHTAQRMAMEADGTWGEDNENAAIEGMKAARGIGLLTYRTIEAYIQTQNDEDNEKLDNYKASSYIKYQGEKLAKRFNAYSYWYLSKALDTHNVARGRGSLVDVLNSIKAKTLIVSIDSDILIPVSEQKTLAENIPGSKHEIIHSDYGHDGFLIEHEKITAKLKDFFSNK
ncbi:homoserine O-acetyltransferase [Reichenbachiella sp. MALMAid0571]|uniref:homoserine O-acetyltransferase family protein n=1 Tax=Reichenbachiella sp. MALMAid0571 TaxID=3143939 RepID=UPI0032DE6560